MLWCTTVASLTVFAQSKIPGAGKKEKTKATFGIQAGKELLLGQNAAATNHAKHRCINSKSITYIQPITKNLKIETGVNLGILPKTKGTERLNKISVPLTVQYYLRPEKCKLRPYCGAGIQGKTYSGEEPASSIKTDVQCQHNSHSADTKYITLLFTQGVTFEVNTKVQVSQSLHFIPGSNNKEIGINFGVGYKFP